MLRTHKGKYILSEKKIRFVTAFDLIKSNNNVRTYF